MIGLSAARRSRLRPAFSLVELVVVVLVLGVIAAMAASRVANHGADAQIRTTAAQIRLIEEAAQIYLAREGDWPRDTTPGKFPVDFTGLLSPGLFERPTPMGGVWDWNSEDRWGDVYAGISIRFPVGEFPEDQCRQLDAEIDDGDLNTGRVQRYRTRHLQVELAPTLK